MFFRLPTVENNDDSLKTSGETSASLHPSAALEDEEWEGGETETENKGRLGWGRGTGRGEREGETTNNKYRRDGEGGRGVDEGRREERG